MSFLVSECLYKILVILHQTHDDGEEVVKGCQLFLQLWEDLLVIF